MTITMHDPQGQLLTELGCKGITQDSIALTYAFILRQEPRAADWPRLNAAIMARWKGKSALKRIKKKAWKYAAEGL